jgi:hypothetical protein
MFMLTSVNDTDQSSFIHALFVCRGNYGKVRLSFSSHCKKDDIRHKYIIITIIVTSCDTAHLDRF